MTMMELINTVLTEQTQYLIWIFIAILVLEIASGVLKAIKNHTLDSKIFREGLVKKAGYLLLIVLALLISIVVQIPYLLYSIMICVSCSESVSILENLIELGIYCPDFLKDILVKTKQKTEDGITKNETK